MIFLSSVNRWWKGCLRFINVEKMLLFSGQHVVNLSLWIAPVLLSVSSKSGGINLSDRLPWMCQYQVQLGWRRGGFAIVLSSFFHVVLLTCKIGEAALLCKCMIYYQHKLEQHPWEMHQICSTLQDFFPFMITVLDLKYKSFSSL